VGFLLQPLRAYTQTSMFHSVHAHVIKYTHARTLLAGWSRRPFFTLKQDSSFFSDVRFSPPLSLSLSLFLSLSLSLSLYLSPSRAIRERNGKGFLDPAIFESTWHPGLNKPTICVEDYLICYIFLTNHKHPVRVEMAEEWKGYSREPQRQSTRRRQRRPRENFVN